MSGTGWSLPLSSTCRNSCPLWGMTSCGMNQKDFLLLMCVGRCPFYLQEWGLWAPTQSGLVFTMHTLDPLIPGMCFSLCPLPTSQLHLAFFVSVLIRCWREPKNWAGWTPTTIHHFWLSLDLHYYPLCLLSFLSNWPTYPVFYSITIFEHLLLARYHDLLTGM